MKIKIASKEYNPLLKRREVSFELEHSQTKGTPTRFEVRKKIAAELKIDLDLVYIKRMGTKTGTMVAVGEANAYDSVEQVKLVEPEHIVARNTPPPKPTEKETPPKPTEKETPPKPTEKETPPKPTEKETPPKPTEKG